MTDPRFASQEVTVGNPASSVAVCTLWSDRGKVLAALEPREYAAAGNLYSLGGIGLLVRSLLANPQIRHLVVCGADATGTGRALLRLFREGPGPDGTVPGTRARLDPAIPADRFDRLRAAVNLVDLRGVTDPDRVAAAVRALPHLPPWGEPQPLVPAAPPTVSGPLPSEVVGLRFAGRTIDQVWLDLLHALLELGPAVGSARWLVAPLAVVEADQAAGSPTRPQSRWGAPALPDWLPSAPDPAAPERLDALAAALGRELAAGPQAGRAWSGRAAPPVPGLVAVEATRLDDRLWLVGHFGPLDAFAWPARACALQALRSRLAAALAAEPGPFALLAGALVLESADRERAGELVARRRPASLAFRSDPRGCFHVALEAGQIVAEHEVEGVGRSGRVFRGTDAATVYRAILQAGLVSRLDHAAYLGAELARAETALRHGWPYRQDEPPGPAESG